MEQRRWRLVIVHEDADTAEVLAELCRGQGFEVAWSWSCDAALRRIVTWPADLVLTAWDRPLGQQIYRWALRRDLGSHFVFVVDEIVPRLERAATQHRAARLDDRRGILEMVRSLRHHLRAAEAAQLRAARARLLLVEDDPEQRAAMADLLNASGYDVVAADGVRAAVAALEPLGEAASVEAVLSDWTMADGSGAELRNWVASHRPDLLASLVFITGGDIAGPSKSVFPAPVLPKGQDSASLVDVLTRAAKRSDA